MGVGIEAKKNFFRECQPIQKYLEDGKQKSYQNHSASGREAMTTTSKEQTKEAFEKPIGAK